MDTQNQHKEHWLNLIIDRLTGTISEDSDLCLQEWIHASDENSRYFKNMELLWHSMEVVHVNPAKRNAMVVKNEKRFLKQKRNALKNPDYSHHPVKTQASFKRLLKAV